MPKSPAHSHSHGVEHQLSRSIVGPADQPTTLRENRSMTTAPVAESFFSI